MFLAGISNESPEGGNDLLPGLERTPARRAFTAPPTPAQRRIGSSSPELQRNNAVRGSVSARMPLEGRPTRPGGLSTSARRLADPNMTVTPHSRRIMEVLNSRRSQHLTPRLAQRRRSTLPVVGGISGAGARRETLQPTLKQLSKVLVDKGKRFVYSSSSPANDSSLPDQDNGGGPETFFRDEDDDEDATILEPPPRFSLPLDERFDEGDEPHPHRSAGLEDLDDNMTMQSIELPRRALQEQHPARSSHGEQSDGRISDYFARAMEHMRQAHDFEDGSFDAGFFPPEGIAPIAFDDMGTQHDQEHHTSTYERVDGNTAETRRETLGIQLPSGDGDEGIFVMETQIQDSPSRRAQDDDQPGYFDDDGMNDNFGELESEEHRGGQSENDDSATTAQALGVARKAPKKRGLKLSKHGIEYPSLPSTVVKRLAQTFATTSGASGKGKIAPDALEVLMQASDWFFEQVCEDLEAYANHAKRKNIEESDILTLMRRQRQITASATPFSLAQRHLPRELLQELRMPPPIVPPKRQRRAAPAPGGSKEVGWKAKTDGPK